MDGVAADNPHLAAINNVTGGVPSLPVPGGVERGVMEVGNLVRMARRNCPEDELVGGSLGVLNNLPIDIMRDQAGIVLSVDVDTLGGMAVDFEEFPSPWRLLWDRVTRRGRLRSTPSIVDITLASFRASNRKHVAMVKGLADLCIEPALPGLGILQFSRLEDIVRTGYDCAKAALDRLPVDSPVRQVRGRATA